LVYVYNIFQALPVFSRIKRSDKQLSYGLYGFSPDVPLPHVWMCRQIGFVCETTDISVLLSYTLADVFDALLSAVFSSGVELVDILSNGALPRDTVDALLLITLCLSCVSVRFRLRSHFVLERVTIRYSSSVCSCCLHLYDLVYGIVVVRTNYCHCAGIDVLLYYMTLITFFLFRYKLNLYKVVHQSYSKILMHRFCKFAFTLTTMDVSGPVNQGCTSICQRFTYLYIYKSCLYSQ
jgi:hypothetical protein